RTYTRNGKHIKSANIFEKKKKKLKRNLKGKWELSNNNNKNVYINCVYN
ncbi:hypothetical protein DOY81_006785, partial [Sarcophaga bullata]